MDTQSYSLEELTALGVTLCGDDIRVDRGATLFNPKWITIGNHCRIDSQCILSAGEKRITLGRYIHIGAGCYLFGSGDAIVLEDFAGLSSRVSVYTSTDDYLEGWLTNPTVPAVYRRCTIGPVTLRRHVVVGSGAIIMPSVELGIGSSVGALCLVTRSLPPYVIAYGNPMQLLPKKRDSARLQLLEEECRKGDAG